MTEPGAIVLLRHGQTAWSMTGRHTGLTDLPLTEQGERDARAAGERVGATRYALRLASPLQRARRTALLAGLTTDDEPLLVERHYGTVEGLSSATVRTTLGDPQWDVWDDDLQGTPATVPPPEAFHGPGETLAQVGGRCDAVLERCRPVVQAGEHCVLVAHSHLLRVLAARWLGLAPASGRHLVLDAGHTAHLGYERQTPALLSWNV